MEKNFIHIYVETKSNDSNDKNEWSLIKSHLEGFLLKIENSDFDKVFGLIPHRGFPEDASMGSKFHHYIKSTPDDFYNNRWKPKSKNKNFEIFCGRTSESFYNKAIEDGLSEEVELNLNPLYDFVKEKVINNPYHLYPSHCDISELEYVIKTLSSDNDSELSKNLKTILNELKEEESLGKTVRLVYWFYKEIKNK